MTSSYDVTPGSMYSSSYDSLLENYYWIILGIESVVNNIKPIIPIDFQRAEIRVGNDM